MNRKAQYPSLFTLFAGYFAAALDESTEEETLATFRADCSASEVPQTLAELRLLLLDSASWEWALAQANRYYPTLAEKKAWFAMIEHALR